MDEERLNVPPPLTRLMMDHKRFSVQENLAVLLVPDVDSDVQSDPEPQQPVSPFGRLVVVRVSSPETVL